MSKINATVVADSINPQGDRLTSLLITFPRILLSEVNTHRMLSKNTSSSRAIPFEKMVQAVQNNPFIPIAWQKHHSGMQGSDYKTGNSEIQLCINKWLEARDNAIQSATLLNKNEIVTKQLCNRLLEPFMWTTMLITGSKEGWNNFFNLRCPQYVDNDNIIFKSKKDYIENSNWDGSNEFTELDWLQINKGQAEIHMMMLSEKIYDAVNESTPLQLEAGEYHIPFEDKLSGHGLTLEEMIKCSVAMAARTSYTVVGDEKEIDHKKMIELHDKLIAYDPPHSSPMEHCAKAMSDDEYNCYYKGYFPMNGENDNNKKQQGWCYNLKGFISYRYMIDNKINL